MVAMINEALVKIISYGKHQLWNVPVLLKYGYRLMVVTNIIPTFYKFSIFAFCVYTLRSSSAYAIEKFYLNFK